MNCLAWLPPALWLLLVIGVSIRSAAEEAPQPIVQRWGIGEPEGPIAHHSATDRLLTAQRGGAVLWDTDSGLAIRSFAVDGRQNPHVTAVGFSRDGARLLIGGKISLRLRDVRSGDRIVEMDTGGRLIIDADLSPDGRWVAAACDDAAVRIWDAESGRIQWTLREHRWMLTHIRFSPDSTQLLSGGDDRLGVLWDVASGRLVHRLASPTEVRGAAFSEDGKRLLTYGTGEFWHTARVVVWNRASGLPLQVIARPFRSAWFAGDDVILLQPDGERLRWTAERHERPPEPEEFPIPTESARFRTYLSQDHWSLRSYRDQPTAELVSPSGEAIPLPLPRSSADPQVPLDISGDGRWLLTGGGYGGEDRNCVVWDLHEGRLHQVLIPGTFARFAPDSTRIAIARHQTITLFHRDSGETLQTIRIDKGAIESLQFLAGGDQLLTASGDWYDGDQGQLLLWDITSGRQLRSYAATDKAVTFAQATPDEQRIVASFTPGNDGAAGVDQISVFDTASGERTADLALPGNRFNDPLLDPQGEFFILEHSLREALTWDLATLEQRHRFPPRLAALSPDGQVLGTVEDRGKLNFWNIETGEHVGSRVMPLGQSRESFFHPGGQLFLSPTPLAATGESLLGISVGFWNLQSGELEAELLTFADGRDWLIRTAAGHFAGSEGGLRRVAWRRPGSDSVTLDATLSETHTRPEQVATTLSQSLPKGVRLIDLFADQSQADQIRADQTGTPPEESDPPGVERYEPHQVSRKMREETIRAIEEAGGEVVANIHGYATSIHLEHRPLETAIVERLVWVRSTERLYLAATGITDEQLEWVGMMGNVKRLSLWGNGITDAGMNHLATLWNLEVLDIHDTEVTAEGLNQLWLLPNLKTLIVPAAVDLDRLGPLQRLRKIEILQPQP